MVSQSLLMLNINGCTRQKSKRRGRKEKEEGSTKVCTRRYANCQLQPGIHYVQPAKCGAKPCSHFAQPLMQGDCYDQVNERTSASEPRGGHHGTSANGQGITHKSKRKARKGEKKQIRHS